MADGNFRYVVFIVLLVLLIVFIYEAITFSDTILANAFSIGAVIVFLALVWKHDAYLLQLVDYERAVIYKFGKINRVGGPGWVFIIPGIETYALVDLRIKTLDIKTQEVITKDGVKIVIDPIVYLKVRKDNQSVVNSVIAVDDYVKATELFVVSTLRDVMSSMQLSEVLSSIDVINAQLKENLEKVSREWGISVESVEISDIKLPESIITAMNEQKAAVQQKLARIERAMAQKAEIEAVKEAAAGLDDKALAYYYIRAIENMSKTKGSKVFFPAEFSNLAASFTESTKALSPRERSKSQAQAANYQEMLKKYINDSVKKAKKEDKE